MNEINQQLIDEHHDMLFGIRRSIRYHNHRVRFYDQINHATTFLSALAATGVITTVLGNFSETFQIAFSSIVIIFATLDLVIGSTRKSRLHHQLYVEFIELEKYANSITNSNLSEQILTEIKNRRLDIEAKEPPALRVLDCICHNQLVRAMGGSEDQYVPITPTQRLFANFIDLNEHSLRKAS